MSLTDLWRNMREKMAADKATPAKDLLPRMRESARLRALGRPGTSGGGTPADEESSITRVTPFANEIQASAAPIAPPPWPEVFPGHHRALVNDLAKRGENMANWEIQDGRDLGVSESGHTVAFVLHKIGTSATIRVELTLYKGQLSKVRVN